MGRLKRRFVFSLLSLCVHHPLFAEMMPPIPLSEIAPQIPVSMSFELKPNVMVDKPMITLEDVAQCRSSVDMCSESYGIEVAKSPIFGEKLVVTSEDLLGILAKEWPQMIFAFEGAPYSVVTQKGVTVEIHELSQQISVLLESWNPELMNQRVMLEQVITPKKIMKSYESSALVCPHLTKELSQAMETKSSFVHGTSCYFQQDENQSKDIPFTLQIKVKIQEQILVTTRYLDRNESLESQKLTLSWRDRNQVQSQMVSDPKEVEGYSLKVALPKGAPLYRYHMMRPDTIQQGAQVMVLFQRDAMTLKGKGKSLLGGYVGDRISVKLIPSQKIIQAKIIDSNTVQSIQ